MSDALAQQDTSDVVTISRYGAVALITLNRPMAMNAVNSQLSTELGNAVEQLSADRSLAVGVITGSGRAFCAGADLKEVAAGRSVYAPEHPEWGFAGLVQHFVDKPLIAAVNGFALGGGTELMLACDLAVISQDATLGLPEVKRGLIAGAGGLIRLPRQVPLKIAMEAALTGDEISAQTAAQWGLVNRLVPKDDVVAAALSLAAKVAANAPLAVRASKRTIHKSAEFGSDWSQEVWKMSGHEFRQVIKTRDAAEGPRAFAEKRPPNWSGE